MANKLKALPASVFRSFGDLPRDAIMTVEVVPDPKMFVPWTPEGMMLTTIGKATETLQTWLTARFADLVREKVALERIDVVHAGGRTIVKVDGKQRFEFKLKCNLEGK